MKHGNILCFCHVAISYGIKYIFSMKISAYLYANPVYKKLITSYDDLLFRQEPNEDHGL